MLTPRIRVALVALAASAGLAGCTNLGPYGGIGVGVGSGYGGYGGYGYDPYYSGYGSAYGYNPYGWYNGYYYPGSGYWVYDPDGHHHPIDGDQKAYWSNLREKIRARALGAQATTDRGPRRIGARSASMAGCPPPSPRAAPGPTRARSAS